MTGRKLRWLGFGLVASAGASLLALTSAMNAAFAYGETPIADAAITTPVPATTEVMGGSGLPIPPSSYVEAVNNLFIQPNLPGTTPTALFTPEGLYPLTGVKTLPLDTSVSEGVTILNDTIAPQLAADTPVGVFGYSQSAIIASLEMQQLDPSGMPSTLPASFVLIGDPMNPNGGLLERFVGFTTPSLGLTFYGATPADSFPTAVYTLEYDGYADFCQYPINFVCDLNAFLGIEYVHGTYPDLTTAQVTPVADGGQAIVLPTEGPTETTYYMIPVENLPLLDPVRDIPVIGNPIADLLQPDLTVIVNLGYGSIEYGWSQGPANVPTPFGLFPNIPLSEIIAALLSGAQQGVQNFAADLSSLSASSLASSLSVPSLSDLAGPLTALSATASDPASLTDIVNTLSSVASTAYATLLPTADIINTLLTSIPAYDVTLFVDSLEAGNLVDAIGYPIAANTALFTLAGGFEFEVLADAASTIVTSLMSLIP